jgi:hypothetical protein
MGRKSVIELAGILPVYRDKLVAHGFDKAYVVLGQFLLLKMNKDMFINWLAKVADADKMHATACYDCLYQWTENYL